MQNDNKYILSPQKLTLTLNSPFLANCRNSKQRGFILFSFSVRQIWIGFFLYHVKVMLPYEGEKMSE